MLAGISMFAFENRLMVVIRAFSSVPKLLYETAVPIHSRCVGLQAKDYENCQ